MPSIASYDESTLVDKLEYPKKDMRAPIHVIPPWPLANKLAHAEIAINPFRKEHGWVNKFVIMYSGNHSLVHPLDTILKSRQSAQR